MKKNINKAFLEENLHQKKSGGNKNQNKSGGNKNRRERHSNINHSLTTEEVQKLLPNSGVLTYDELVAKPIKEMLNKYPDKAVVTLVRQRPSYGHYVAIYLKEEGDEQGIHIFDSYGKGFPDGHQWYNNIPQNLRKKMGEDAPYLLQRVIESGEDLYYNDFPYQHFGTENGKPITTCGRWAVLRTQCKNLTCCQFRDLIMDLRETMEITSDELVCLLVD
jgi:hypothetical protein